METAAGKGKCQAARDVRNINTALPERESNCSRPKALVADIGKMDPEKVVGRFFTPGRRDTGKRICSPLCLQVKSSS